jgi:short-chain Z-isoprenyl diphosphate synthase
LPEFLQESMRDVEAKTVNHDRYSLNVALAYGGREEITDAFRSLMEDEITNLAESLCSPSSSSSSSSSSTSTSSAREALDVLKERVKAITPAHISSRLYTSGVPEPDFIIRTSGEMRVGGFLMWQSAYSEFYFCDAMWPAFRKIDFLRALRAYNGRARRYGK